MIAVDNISLANLHPSCQVHPTINSTFQMPVHFADESNRNIVQRHVADSFSHHRPKSLDDSSQHVQHALHSRLSLPVDMDTGLSSDESYRLSSFGLIPGHEVVDTSVRFLGVVSEENHCEFQLLVDTGIVRFNLQKRYSEFRDLRDQLLLGGGEKHLDGKCRNGACLQLAQQRTKMKFPRRKLGFKFRRDDDVRTARQRQTQLQHFLNTVLGTYRSAPKRQVRCCVNSECCVLKAIRSFLHLGAHQICKWKAASYGGSIEVIASLAHTSISSPARSCISEAVDGRTADEAGVRELI